MNDKKPRLISLNDHRRAKLEKQAQKVIDRLQAAPEIADNTVTIIKSDSLWLTFIPDGMSLEEAIGALELAKQGLLLASFEGLDG